METIEQTGQIKGIWQGTININKLNPYCAAFPAEIGTSGHVQPVIFTNSSNNKNIPLMNTDFIEQLSATAPAGLEQTTAALCGEMKGLLKARTPESITSRWNPTRGTQGYATTSLTY